MCARVRESEPVHFFGDDPHVYTEMCGVVGVLAAKPDADVEIQLVRGVHELEYRGYDSAGLAVCTPDGLYIRKTEGTFGDECSWTGDRGIAHTRWATHGSPSERNAHPHVVDGVAIVCNGIVENHEILYEESDYERVSDTDSEVIAHLIAACMRAGEDFETAVRSAVERLNGTFAFLAVHAETPGVILAVTRGAPLIIGRSRILTWIASDAAAIPLGVTERIPADAVVAVRHFGGTSKLNPRPLELRPPGGYMYAEIMEQADIHIPGVSIRPPSGYTVFRACGSSLYAAMFAAPFFEAAGFRCKVEYAHEGGGVERGDLVILVSQSGETADTLRALREANRSGAYTFAIVNATGSTMESEADTTLRLGVGRERAVAATKTFTAQIRLLAALVGHETCPISVERLREHSKYAWSLAETYADAEHFMYLGRGSTYAVALEGALKMNEIAHVHSSAYPAGELKHGPLALIDDRMPVVCIGLSETTLEILRARGAVVVDIPYVSVFEAVVPLQLFAYHVARRRGLNVDRPRHLAKSVTV